MDNKYVICSEELTHHGIPGMKWGIRRYQNKDGSLTNAGKRRYEKELAKAKAEQKVIKNRERTKAKLDKLEEMKRDNAARKKALDDSEKSKKQIAQEKAAAEERARLIKSGKVRPKNMSDDELKAWKDRLDLEKSYSDALKNQKMTTRGSRFSEKFKDSLVDKMAEQVGADLLTQTAKAFGADFINKAYGKTKVVKDEANSTKDNPVYKTIIDEVVFTNNERKK